MYNAANPDFFAPKIQLSVSSCADSNDVVQAGECKPCSQVLPGSYRSGNSCVSSPPPTATIQANDAGFQANGKNGKKVSVALGQQVTVKANYASYVPPGATPPPGQSLILTINRAKVVANVNDFPIYVNLADLPSSFWSAETGSCGDIRVYASNGTTELPREVVTCNTAARTGELWFKAPFAIHRFRYKLLYRLWQRRGRLPRQRHVRFTERVDQRLWRDVAFPERVDPQHRRLDVQRPVRQPITRQPPQPARLMEGDPLTGVVHT